MTETAANRRMFRYEVPIDDQAHVFALSGDPVAVASARDFPGFTAEFWAEHTDGAPQAKRAFRVFGTGHRLPVDARHVGTLPRTREGLVFHLYELPVPAGGD